MTYLYENSLPILFVGFVCFAFSLLFFVKTGRKLGLALALMFAAITGALVYLEKSVVTETEEVAATLHQIELDLEENDHAKVLEHFSQDASQLRAGAESLLGRITIEKVTIKNNLEIDITKPGQEAEAKFNAVGRLGDRGGSLQPRLIPRFFTVQFVKESDRWRVASYTHEDPRRGMSKQE